MPNYSQETGAALVGGDNSRAQKRKHLVFITAIILLIIFVVGVVLILYFHHSNINKIIPKEQSAGRQLTPDQDYQYLASQGKYASAEQVLEQQLAKTNNVNDELTIYYQQSALAVSFKKYSDAEKYANEAKKLAPDSPIPYVSLAQLAKAQGDTAVSKQDWQQAITNLNPNVSGYNLIKQEYQTSLDNLQ